jgi:competence protein ComEC
MPNHWSGTILAATFGIGLTVPGAGGAQAIPDSTMAVHFIDVGQGAAAILEFSCGAMMIDVGGQSDIDSQRLVQYLDRFFQRRSDLNRTIRTLIISHNHIDHTRALLDIATRFTVNTLIEHGLRGVDDPGDKPLRDVTAAAVASHMTFVDLNDADVSPGMGLITKAIDPVDCSGTDPQITVLSADLAQNPGWTATAFKNKNNQSIVIRIDFGRASFLFTGDLQDPAIETLVDFYADTPLLDVDVWHTGHHGSANGATWSLMNALNKPEIAVISMGPCDRNVGLFNAFRFGHPRADIITMLRAAVVGRRTTPKRVPVALGVQNFKMTTMRDRIYGTGWDGNIVITATKSGRYRVDTDRPVAPASCG